MRVLILVAGSRWCAGTAAVLSSWHMVVLSAPTPRSPGQRHRVPEEALAARTPLGGRGAMVWALRLDPSLSLTQHSGLSSTLPTYARGMCSSIL